MNIIIKKENEEKIKEELLQKQKRARTRIITLENIYEMIKEIEKHFSFLKKKDFEGINVWCDYHTFTAPSAYKGIPESTKILLFFKNDKWHLANIYRGRCSDKYEFKFTEENEKAIINRLKIKND